MPFAGYKDWNDCISKNRDKEDPEAYCGSIKNKVEEADLLTDAGGTKPLDNSLETPDGSNKSFEVTAEDKDMKRLGKEEGIASVSGAPDSMAIIDDEPLVLPNTESLTDDELGGKLGKELGEEKHDEILDKNSPIKLNENYIQDQFGVLYRPVYAGESIDVNGDDILIFENKYYTTEGLGNCVFCQGAGKVTVENLGLKDCPDCDGTGDVQQTPMGGLGEDPNAGIPPPMEKQVPPSTPMGAPSEQQPNNGAPNQLGEEPEDPSLPPKKNPKYDEESILVKESYAKEEDGNWITVSGNHILVKKGQSKKQAIQDFLDNKNDDLEEWKPEQSDQDKYNDDTDYGGGASNPEEDTIDDNYYPSTTNYTDKELSKKVNDELELNKKKSDIKKMTDKAKKETDGFIGKDEQASIDLDKTIAKMERAKKGSLKLTGKPKTDLKKLSRFHQGDTVEIDNLTDGQQLKLYKMMIAQPDFGVNGSSEVEMEQFWNSMTPKERKEWGVYSKDDNGKPLAEKEWSELSGNLSTRNTKGHVLEGGKGDKGVYGMMVNKGNDPTMSDYWIKLWKKKRGQVVPNEDENDFTLYDEDENDRTNESYGGEAFTKVIEACGCKKKAQESIDNYKKFIQKEITVLKSRAHAGEAVSIMYGLPTVSKQGRKIKGTLAYAGVSLNDRIYLPEELAKGHGKTLPLLLNHSNIAGAENELDRLDDEMIEHLENEKDYQVGEVTLTWDPQKLTLYYEGVVDHPFFQKEIDDMDMAVSLGIYYDSDSPKVCDESCYTLIKGAEFREVSLVYHAGFPIATIEAVEAMIKEASINAFKGKEATAEEELDELMPTGQPIDVEEKPKEIDEHPIIVEAVLAPQNFSVRGVAGMTISNSNGVQKYRLDPNMSYETNMVHFDVAPQGAHIFGEGMKVNTQMQPEMTTPPELTKEIEKRPDIEFTDADEDILNK